MKCFGTARIKVNLIRIEWIKAALTALTLSCISGASCAAPAVRSNVIVQAGELTLEDVLEPGTCPSLAAAAKGVSLGEAPRAGNERVLDGHAIHQLVDQLKNSAGNLDTGTDDHEEKEEARLFPARILVQQAGGHKSCAEIAEVLGVGQKSADLNCDAALHIARDSPLELISSGWNAGLRRREFVLRCQHPQDCVPFLVWAADLAPDGSFDPVALRAAITAARDARPALFLVKRGQTAMLIWDRAGIRITLPVTCLEAGEVGQFVRVRFPHGNRILRAEVIGPGRVRAIP